jgi:hypothetical protein
MPKKTTIRQEKRVMLTDSELIEKYGKDKPLIPISKMVNTMLNTPNPNAPAKTKRI